LSTTTAELGTASPPRPRRPPRPPPRRAGHRGLEHDHRRVGHRIATAAGSVAVHAALWIGALLVAVGALADPFPAELDQLVAMYFERFPPVAKA